MIWLGKWAAEEIERWRTAATENAVRFASEIGENIRLKEENARLRSDLDWFKLRLNQVEMERAMLMQDRIGVKISVPQFVPATENPDEALNKVVDLTTVGGDADDVDTDADPNQNFGIDYRNLPGYKGTRRGLNG